MFARNFVQTCLGPPGSGSSKRKKWLIFFSSYGKCLTIFDLVQGVWLVGTHFRRLRQSKVLHKIKLAMSPSSTVHGGQYDHQICGIRVAIACGIRGWKKIVLFCLEQLVVAKKCVGRVRSVDPTRSDLRGLTWPVNSPETLRYFCITYSLCPTSRTSPASSSS